MKNKSFIIVCLSSSLLIGCGGGGSSDSSPSFTGNGIYSNTADLAVMIVDSTRDSENIIVGDFSNDSIYFTNTATTTVNTMTTTGLTYADTATFAVDTDLVLTATFDSSEVTLNGEVDGTNLIYSMDKASDSLSLAEIVGTYTDADDGSTWQVNSDGSFIITGTCIITGDIERSGAYWNITDASAVSCTDSEFNGTYEGVFLTVNHDGHDYIAGLLANSVAMQWGSTAIN
ncbi:hypothetical protein [Vibrio sp. MA40-2]|uniref:hypothetical protein n=1 Tax=Vibrio sp. MA40-2 TaxID=3391828 RepID=UPI0039A56359